MKFLFLFLGVFFVIPSISLAFPDVSSTHRFANEIQYVQDAGIVQGYSDGSFRPELTINRAEFTKIIISSLYTKEEIESCDTSKFSFPDVSKNEWYVKFVCLAQKNGIINGYGDGTFKPNNTITLPEAMKIILKSYKIDASLEKDPCGDWASEYLSYFEVNIFSTNKFPSFSTFLKESAGSLEMTGRAFTTSSDAVKEGDLHCIYSADFPKKYKISRGDMAYFIEQMETRKTIVSDANFQTISHPNSGFSVQVPKKDDIGVIVPVEYWSEKNQEYSLHFNRTGYEVLPIGFFSKKVPLAELGEYFRPQFESWFGTEGWDSWSLNIGDEAKSFANEDKYSYAKRCISTSTFSPLQETRFYNDTFLGNKIFSGDLSNLVVLTFDGAWCTITGEHYLYDIKNNRLIKLLNYMDNVMFQIHGRAYPFTSFQLQ